MTPRPDDQIDHPIVVTAWHYMLPLDSVDTAKITRFFVALVGKPQNSVRRFLNIPKYQWASLLGRPLIDLHRHLFIP
jgi:hypothetical protein